MKQLIGKPLKDFLRKDERPSGNLAFVLQDVDDPVNVGAAFRIADACDARALVLAGSTPRPPNETIHGVGRGTHRRVPWSYSERTDEALLDLKARGYRVYAVEVTGDAVPYYAAAYPESVCLVVGNEHHGVTRRTLAACDAAIYIPMYGRIRSLNVHVALGIAAYHVLHRDR
jgi:tRNA (guanosine-2'-O-)-methyltransferase